jgi:glycosyltransferase involved in cell wall biosynthesis
MKVLFVSGGDYKYGAPKSMMTLIEGLRDIYNIEPVLLTKKRNELNEYCDKNGIENYSFWYRDIMVGSPYSNKLLTGIKHVVKYALYLYGGITQKNINNIPIDFSNIDIIHSNTNRQDIGAYIANKYNKKHVWHIREMGREDYNVVFYKKNCIEYMNKNADAFIMISDAVRNKWNSMQIEDSKAYTVYDGMDSSAIKKRTKKGKDGIVRIVITGHIQPNKGQIQIVKAIAKLPDNLKARVQLDIIGEAYKDYKKQIDKIIETNNLKKQIHFLGYQNNVNEILSEYDIGVTCSKAEGFGRCTVEYMLAGLLTIASDTGANPEIIRNRESGLLYEYDNIESLTKAIQWCMENPNESEIIAEEGYKFAMDKYSIEQSVNKVYEVYKNVI